MGGKIWLVSPFLMQICNPYRPPRGHVHALSMTSSDIPVCSLLKPIRGWQLPQLRLLAHLINSYPLCFTMSVASLGLCQEKEAVGGTHYCWVGVE